MNGEKLLRDTFALLNAGDIEACTARLSETFEMHHAGRPTVTGRRAWADGAAQQLSAFPDFRVSIEHLVADADLIAVRIRLTGTHTGTWFGMPPTKRSVDYTSHEFYGYADGLLTAEWICSDTATLLHQLGVDSGGAGPAQPSAPVASGP